MYNPRLLGPGEKHGTLLISEAMWTSGQGQKEVLRLHLKNTGKLPVQINEEWNLRFGGATTDTCEGVSMPGAVLEGATAMATYSQVSARLGGGTSRSNRLAHLVQAVCYCRCHRLSQGHYTYITRLPSGPCPKEGEYWLRGRVTSFSFTNNSYWAQ